MECSVRYGTHVGLESLREIYMELTPAQALPILNKLLSEKKLSVFAGSGVSVPSGLPTWDGFIDQYIKICEQLNSCLDPSLRFDAIIEDAKKHTDSNLIQTITALKDKLRLCQDSGIDIGFCHDRLYKLFYNAKASDYHRLMVSTNFNHIITTNYDSLFEDAACDLGFSDLLVRSYSYIPEDTPKITSAIYGGKTSIIHAHGKIADIKLDHFVLTRDDYLSIMKHNPGFRMILNTIFIMNSVLFVGYGGSDPHFEDVIDDLNLSLNWKKSGSLLPKCYIMMRKDKVTPIREFLNDTNRVDIISFDTYPEQVDFLEELQKNNPRKKP